MGGLCKWNHVLYNLLSSVSSPWCVLLFILEMNCIRYEDSFVWVNNILVCDLIFFSCSSSQIFELFFFSLALMNKAALHIPVQESV